ncbi:MAG: DinB family protein [Actinobacteria bacterium]|nr:MAG: DinB family protein [Actinomycetota bacterium]
MNDLTPLSATPAELIAAYRRGPSALRRALEGMSPEQLRARPIPGKMSSLEVACHVVDSDQFMCDRAKRTIATARPLLIGIESWEYPGPLAYHERDLELDLRLLDVQREQLAADLERLSPEAWQRCAVHSECGTQTVHEIVHHAVEHLEGHVIAIAEKRAALGL